MNHRRTLPPKKRFDVKISRRITDLPIKKRRQHLINTGYVHYHVRLIAGNAVNTLFYHWSDPIYFLYPSITAKLLNTLKLLPIPLEKNIAIHIANVMVKTIVIDACARLPRGEHLDLFWLKQHVNEIITTPARFNSLFQCVLKQISNPKETIPGYVPISWLELDDEILHLVKKFRVKINQKMAREECKLKNAIAQNTSVIRYRLNLIYDDFWRIRSLVNKGKMCVTNLDIMYAQDIIQWIHTIVKE